MKTALLVEDDEDFRSVLRAALAERGFQTTEAADGRAADAALQRESVDVVIVDGRLPDGSGVDWIARFRARDATTAVIFLSAFIRDSKTFRRLTTELNVSFVLYKPLDPRDLARKAGELVGAPSKSLRGAQRATSNRAPALDDALAALRREFGAKLPAKLDALSRAVAAARHDPSRASEARSLAHRLRGTAGSYAYVAVGEAAGRLEDLLARAGEEDGAVDPFFWTRVSTALDDTRLGAARPADEGNEQESVAKSPHALLVVDDDPDFLQLVREVGRRLAVLVLTAQTPAEALQIAQRHELFGAILDVHLGDEHSFGVADELRKAPNKESMPVAFMSADRTLETRLLAIEAGGTGFFEKPLSADTFASLVQKFDDLSVEASGSVLVVDDDPDTIREYSLHLRRAGLRFDAALTAEAVFERLEKGNPNLIILDVNLPNISGLDVCRAIRMSDRWELLPILIATADGDAATRLRAFRAGASDVLVKPIVPEEFLARVRAQLERAKLVRDRSEKDALSGLLLRRTFADAFQRSLSLAGRDDKPLSVALLDLDHFKRINDEFGHATGDAVIAGLGALLRRKFRVEDLRGRWGGEEFILAFPGQSNEVTGRLIERLLEEFSALRFSTADGGTVSATFSAGVATFPNDGNTMSMLVQHADERLYFSKKTGRNRVRVQMLSESPPPAPVQTPGEVRER